MVNKMPDASNETLAQFCGDKFSVLDPRMPALSDCFESMALVYGPFTMLAITSAFFMGRIRVPDLALKIPPTYTIRFLCTVTALIMSAINSLITMFPRGEGGGYYTIRFAVVTVALMIHALYLRRLLKVHFLLGRGPWLVVLSWLVTMPHFVADTEFLICKAIASSNKLVIVQATIATLTCACQIIYLMCLFVSDARYRTISFDAPDDDVVDDEEIVSCPTSSYASVQRSSVDSNETSPPSPADTSGTVSKVLFGWVRPLMRKGAQRGLNDVDSVYCLPKDINTVNLDEKFMTSLHRLQLDLEDGAVHKNILLLAMHKCFGFIYYCSGVLKLLADCLAFAGPLLLNRLVSFIENTDEPYQHGYYYAAGLLFSTLFGSLLSTHFDYQVSSQWLRNSDAVPMKIC